MLICALRAALVTKGFLLSRPKQQVKSIRSDTFIQRMLLTFSHNILPLIILCGAKQMLYYFKKYVFCIYKIKYLLCCLPLEVSSIVAKTLDLFIIINWLAAVYACVIPVKTSKLHDQSILIYRSCMFLHSVIVKYISSLQKTNKQKTAFRVLDTGGFQSSS